MLLKASDVYTITSSTTRNNVFKPVVKGMQSPYTFATLVGYRCRLSVFQLGMDSLASSSSSAMKKIIEKFKVQVSNLCSLYTDSSSSELCR